MKAVFLTMGLALSFNAMALPTYVCTHGEATRIIDVVYTEPEALVPCEVKYTKSTGQQVLWRAQAQEGYCEEKAQAFAQKQEGFGWTCEQMSAENDGNLEAMDSQPVEVEPSVVTDEAAAMEAKTMQPEVMESQTIESEVMDSQTMESEVMDSQTMESMAQPEKKMEMAELSSVESNAVPAQAESQMAVSEQKGEMTDSSPK